MQKKDLLALAGICVIWITCALVINPSAEWAIADDWSYSRTLEHFLLTGEFRPGGWTSMPLIVHTWWGAAFSVFTGFSMTCARMSQITAALLVMVITYCSCRSAGNKSSLSLIAAGSTGFTVSFFGYAYSYHTDFTFAVFFGIAFWLYATAAYRSSQGLMWLGFIAAASATFTRDVGLAAPVASLAAIAMYHKSKRLLLLPAMHIAVLAVGLLFFREWMAGKGILPVLYDDGKTRILRAISGGLPQIITTTGKNILLVVAFMGTFLLPLYVLLLSNFRKLYTVSEKNILCSVMLLIGASAVAAWLTDQTIFLRIRFMQFDEILQNDWLPDVYNAYWLRLPVPDAVTVFIAVFSLTGGAFFIANLAVVAYRLFRSRAGATKQQYWVVASLSVVLVYLLPLLIGNTYNRYLLIVCPLFSYIIFSVVPANLPISRTKLTISFIIIMIFALISVVGTRDNFERYRTLDRAQAYLFETLKAKPEDTDGGFCFNGWWLYDPNFQHSRGKNWWWVKNDLFLLRGNSADGYHPVAAFPFRRLLAGGRMDTTYILQRNPRATLQ